MVRWLRAAVVPLVLVLLISLSGLVLGRIYADDLLMRLVAGAALGSVAASVAVRRLPSWTAAPISVLLLAGYTLFALKIAADRAELTGPLASIVRDSLVNGIPRLLTAMIPVEATPDTVVVPIVAAWLAGLAGAEIAVRAGGRVLLGCVPAAALYVGALYVVGPNASAAGWPSVAFAGLVAAALASSQTFDRTGTAEVAVPTRAMLRWRALGGAAAGLTAVVVLVALAGPWVAGKVSATPVDPRQYVSPPQVDSLDESPLNRISGWALTPAEPLLQVTGPTDGKTRLRLAVLSDYDGATWRVGATYRNAGRVLPPQPAPPATTVDEVRQDITVDGLTGRLLPVVPTPSEVEGARVAYDPATGTLIRPEELRPGVRYTVVSERPTPDLNLLPEADSPTGDSVARFLAIGANVPESIQRLADQLQEGNGAAFDRATAIEEFLAEHYRKVNDAPSGHAYPNLEYFLFGPRNRGGQVGTSEQFAASYALLARLTGLPSRVVVGFDVPKNGRVTAANAVAWPEVLFDDLGWVAFDPMPKSKDPRPVEEDFTPKPTTPPPPPSEAPPPSDQPSASTDPTVLAAHPGDGPSAIIVATGASGSAFLLLAAAALAIVVLRRGRRRRRLTEGPPDDRIAGAWLEFTDALRLAGKPVPKHLAATEAAAHAADVPRPTLRKATPPPPETALPSLDGLVEGINTTEFAPGMADETQARTAADQVTAYAEALRQNRSWWRRLWWSLHPGPLRWHRR